VVSTLDVQSGSPRFKSPSDHTGFFLSHFKFKSLAMLVKSQVCLLPVGLFNPVMLYRLSSCKRPPQKFKKGDVTRAGHLRKSALVSKHVEK